MESYADWLRARDDHELRALLTARPELTVPVPADLGALATRAATVSACARAVDRLDRFSLAVLEALLVRPQPVPYSTLRRDLAASIDPAIKSAERQLAIRGAVDRLGALGLVWGGDRRLRTAPGVRQAIAYPAGLGPPIRAAFASYPVDRLTALLADLDTDPPQGFVHSEGSVERLEAVLADPAPLVEDAGPEARAALDQLMWGPPVGRVDKARRPVRRATATTPIERLLARGLLAATDDRTVTLPREVALWLRAEGGKDTGKGGAGAGRAGADGTGAGRTGAGRTGAGRTGAEGKKGAEPPMPLFHRLPPGPPPLDGVLREVSSIDRMAAGHAFTTVRLIADLLERWGIEPPPVLRSGGLSVRDLRATAGRLEIPEWHAALLIEVAFDAGLLARGGGVDGDWLPTRTYDLWLLRETADRWAVLAGAWMSTDRVPGLAGERDERDRVINALSDESIRAAAPELRRSVLRALADAVPGTTPTGDALRARLAWLRPRRRGNLQDRMVDWTIREAEVLGFTGYGALGSYARVLVAGAADGTASPSTGPSTGPSSGRSAGSSEPTETKGPKATRGSRIPKSRTDPGDPRNLSDLAEPGDLRHLLDPGDGAGPAYREAVERLLKLLPEPVDRVLIQADLTAVAPGPLVAGLARELALMANVESTGGATVYRFTSESVRRALDAGRSAAELTDLLTRHSATPVPQPLTYLIEDVARRHGRLRVGTASSYVRADDPAVLDEIVADRRAESLFLHRLAPTVLASRLTRTELLDALRAIGLSPVAESTEGGVVIMRVDALRAESSRPVHPVRAQSDPDSAMIAAAVRALKAGEEAARHGAEFARRRPEAPSEPPRSASPAMVDDLRQALDRGGRIWIGYIDQQGQASSRIVEPIRLEGGFLTAFDSTRAAVHRFALHRITGVAELDPPSSP